MNEIQPPIDNDEQNLDQEGEYSGDENSQTIESESSEPIFNNNVAELMSAAALIATLTLNTETIAPNLEMIVGAFHLLTFLLLKEAWRAKQEGEYSRQDLARALTRIAAPFLTAGAINNAEAIITTLSSVDQTIGFSQAAADIIPKIIAGLAVGAATTIGIVKAGNELIKAYRSLKRGLTNKAKKAIDYAKSFELQSPVRDLNIPLKKIEIQSPIKLEWQWPFKFRLPFQRKRPPEEN